MYSAFMEIQSPGLDELRACLSVISRSVMKDLFQAQVSGTPL
jgi:hypothetical protein